MHLIIKSNGVIQCLYTEDLDLISLGRPQITRASHVEPDRSGRWWADLSPVNGPNLGPFHKRSEALRAERRWLEDELHFVARSKA